MKYLIAILFFVLCTGCSQLDIVIRWADITATSRADSYFDLISTQKGQLRVLGGRDQARLGQA